MLRKKAIFLDRKKHFPGQKTKWVQHETIGLLSQFFRHFYQQKNGTKSQK